MLNIFAYTNIFGLVTIYIHAKLTFKKKCLFLKLNLYLSPCTKNSSKWIKYLNIRPQTLKLLEKNRGKTLEDADISNAFLNRTIIVQEITAKIDKWDCLKLKRFCIA
jgi:hypothetical protein